MQELVVTLRKQPSNSGHPSQPLLGLHTREVNVTAVVQCSRLHPSKRSAELSLALLDRTNVVPRAWHGRALAWGTAEEQEGLGDGVHPELPFPLAFATLQSPGCSSCVLSDALRGAKAA